RSTVRRQASQWYSYRGMVAPPKRWQAIAQASRLVFLLRRNSIQLSIDRRRGRGRALLNRKSILGLEPAVPSLAAGPGICEGLLARQVKLLWGHEDDRLAVGTA